MKTHSSSTRRKFLRNAGSVLSAPLVVGSGEAVAAVTARPDEPDDLARIRDLHQKYAQAVNAGDVRAVAALFSEPSAAAVGDGIRSVSAERFADHERIRLSKDGQSAEVEIRCVVQTETEMGPDCTLVEMARAQGEGVVRHSEARILETVCVRRDGVWKLARAVFR